LLWAAAWSASFCDCSSDMIWVRIESELGK
jgi:hypothetical protein